MTDREIKRLRSRIAEMDDRIHGRDVAIAEISRERDEAAARIRELEEQLAHRDAAWEQAIQSLAEQGVMMVDDPIAAVRFWLESEGGAG